MRKTADKRPGTSRRGFLRTGVAAAGAIAGVSPGRAEPARRPNRPNFLFIISDQLGLDAISAHGCRDVHTPGIDRLVRRGTTFMESHSTSPVCSPARSSLMTGRMPVETGVISNGRPINRGCPNLGQWFRPAGYETVYCGKWHLPGGYPVKIDGFDVIPVGQGQGDLVDTVVSRSCEAYLKTRGRERPFLLVASLMQPHDICYWAIYPRELVGPKPPLASLADRLPPLPPNHKARPREPRLVANKRYRGFTTDEQWRYYIYIYYRQVEMLDADVGRILDALDDTGQADNTVVIFTSDHGEGRGRHEHVSKWHPYDESMKVPMIVSCPGRIAENHRDVAHLVSGLDVMSTMCDYAGIQPPPDARGLSLRPLLEKKDVTWREFLSADTYHQGRILRTQRYKYVKLPDDPVEQLFDMRADPWETKNLYDDAKYAGVVKDHRRLLAKWQSGLRPVAPSPDMRPLRRRKPKRG